jgi:hypothetical protein
MASIRVLYEVKHPSGFKGDLMRAYSLIVFLFLAVCGVSVASETDIAQIKTEYQSIRAVLLNLKVEKVALDGYSTEGADAKAYRDGNGNIRFSRAELFFESGKEIGEYYYKDEKLIFSLYTTHRYNVPSYLTPQRAKEIGIDAFDPKKTTISEDRYYYKNGKLIRWLGETKKEVDPASQEYKNAEKRVVEFSNELLSKFKRKS